MLRKKAGQNPEEKAKDTERDFGKVEQGKGRGRAKEGVQIFQELWKERVWNGWWKRREKRKWKSL